MQIATNVSLRPYNSFGFEVSAEYFCIVTSHAELNQALDFAKEKALTLLVIGGGSNLILMSDISGLVIINRICHKTVEQVDNDYFEVTAGAGENWHDFVRWTLECGYAGLENLSLIPGTVGAAPMQNIGAYGVEIKDRMVSLDALDLQTGKRRCFSVEECCFGYRDSLFKRHYPGRYLILSVCFRLSRTLRPVLGYSGLASALAAEGIAEPTGLQISDVICKVRQSKLPAPEQIGNAGSFFKNPLIPEQQCHELQQRFPDLVAFEDKSGFRKLAAGWLIDQLGWKGKRLGDAGVYDKQALVLVNHGHATGEEIITLAGQIQDAVNERYGVRLEIEPRVYPDC
ncbi:MAG: UDP-N-acetylmuramate dehydrogenase [Amphritea sp.]